MTGSTRASQAPVQQAYPGDYAQVDQMSTGSVARQRGGGILNRGRSSPRPEGNVGGGYGTQSPYPVQNSYPPQNSYPSASAQPVYSAPARQAVTSGPALAPAVTRASLDSNPTGSVAAAQPAMPTAAPVVSLPQQQASATIGTNNDGGWSRAGGTQVSVNQGETVYNLSRRFGVPADAIMKANGLSSPNALVSGQQIVIPTYVHSARAPVSAPDANPGVADARSSTGSRFDPPANGGVPVPSKAPGERVAVLPSQPGLNDRTQPSTTTAGNNQNTGAPSSGAYTVSSGDTLAAIARRHGTTTTALKAANGLNDGMIRIGQKLVIPGGGSAATTQVALTPKPATDTTTTASVPAAGKQATGAYTPPRQQTDKLIQNAAVDTTTPAPDASGISRMRWPARGRVISGFGGSSGGKKNDGIDIAVPAGTAIRAAENGVVIYAGDGLKEFGNTVLVRHEDGLVTVYGHASKLNVQRGQKVRRGDEIALSGMSGSADSPKLHFEVRKDSTPVNPATYLE